MLLRPTPPELLRATGGCYTMSGAQAWTRRCGPTACCWIVGRNWSPCPHPEGTWWRLLCATASTPLAAVTQTQVRPPPSSNATTSDRASGFMLRHCRVRATACGVRSSAARSMSSAAQTLARTLPGLSTSTTRASKSGLPERSRCLRLGVGSSWRSSPGRYSPSGGGMARRRTAATPSTRQPQPRSRPTTQQPASGRRISKSCQLPEPLVVAQAMGAVLSSSAARASSISAIRALPTKP
mmetsp:Transcript_79775/g.207379  ORF Transcript_79775/g.207379 Transcript_79775/m.207379 type:complete len:239 (-) Transcript_79775:51-767(-)